ncbi:MAG: T9SS type A sorting domain-containing protein [Chitinophagaceae bacterium]|nr:T9SS type A sorting domain-containing protein [Chitinophagaceae bacterium]
MIGKAGEIKYSNLLIIKNTQARIQLSVSPNPASSNIQVRFYSETETVADLRMLDNTGKIVLVQKQKVVKGNNVISLSNLARFSNGSYFIQVQINNNLHTQKIVLFN